MTSIEELGDKLVLNPEEALERSPGIFAIYNALRKKSSETAVSVEKGLFKKTKVRAFEKTLYEFLSLELWHNVLKNYSETNNLKFRAPEPKFIIEEDINYQPIHSLIMEYIEGYEVSLLLKRKIPLKSNGDNPSVKLYPACALHLGALNRIKEMEGFLHSDYDERHIKFIPFKDVAMAIVDLENSINDSSEMVKVESNKIYENFIKKTNVPNKEKQNLRNKYEQGFESIRTPIDGIQFFKELEAINKKYGIKLDPINGYINEIRVNIK
ncbi:MAG: hypothetical protein WC413_03560 [Candidatus Nanoarchaeia archaeon]